jgi:hypothetical protein
VDEVVACCRRVVELKPDFDEAHYNLAVALKDQGKPGEAIACYRRALELTPDFAQAHLNQSMMLLLTGDFERGWAEYQWRWKTATCPPRHYSKAFWDGQPLEGRAIFLYAEQGLGDAIQFVRYVALVKQRGGTVIVGCQGPLLSLFQSCGGIDRLLRKGDQLPALDIQASLESLPGIFHTALDDLPATVPYLFADPALVDRWRQELRHLAGFKIGIAWRGNPRHENDRNRSIPLGCFEPLVRCGGVRLLSLQKGAGVEQLQDVAGRFPITDLGSRLEDFTDTAAAIVNLDLVIACDTAVAHLAGALGTAAWVAIPFVPDWRWLMDRDDSPWYPTVRLFRQQKPGDWAGVFDAMKAALSSQLHGGK